jgi:hypothetical protein
MRRFLYVVIGLAILVNVILVGWCLAPWSETTEECDRNGEMVECRVWRKWPLVQWMPIGLPKPDYQVYPPQYIPPGEPEKPSK